MVAFFRIYTFQSQRIDKIGWLLYNPLFSFVVMCSDEAGVVRLQNRDAKHSLAGLASSHHQSHLTAPTAQQPTIQGCSRCNTRSRGIRHLRYSHNAMSYHPTRLPVSNKGRRGTNGRIYSLRLSDLPHWVLRPYTSPCAYSSIPHVCLRGLGRLLPINHNNGWELISGQDRESIFLLHTTFDMPKRQA